MSQALLITHPTSRFGVEEDRVEEFLENNQDKYDDIFYISSEYDPSPADSLTTFFPDKGNRSDLPPGFAEGFYTRGLRESKERTGRLHSDEIQALESYDQVDVGGGRRCKCVQNTLESLPETQEKRVLESLTYGGK